jgi:hypothetical protein
MTAILFLKNSNVRDEEYAAASAGNKAGGKTLPY